MVDRFVALPGDALACTMGELKIRALRNRAQQAPGRALRYPGISFRRFSRTARCRWTFSRRKSGSGWRRRVMEPVLNNRQAAILIEQYGSIGVRLHSALNSYASLYSASPLARPPCGHREGLRAARRHRSAVALDAGEQSGSASATVRIHARREVVWSLITSCAEALHLVPGLVACERARDCARPVVADGSGM